MAIHPDILYETLKKLAQISDLQVIEYDKDVNKGRFNRFFRFQPVLLLNDDLYQAELLNDELVLSKKEIISFCFNYSTLTDHKSLIIDVITENFIQEYSQIIYDEDRLICEEIIKIMKK